MIFIEFYNRVSIKLGFFIVNKPIMFVRKVLFDFKCLCDGQGKKCLFQGMVRGKNIRITKKVRENT